MRVILGSSSPRRKELLSLVFSDFEIIKPNFEEKQKDGEKPLDYALRNSISKAKSILTELDDPKDCLILSSDTIGLLDGRVFEKPKSEKEAFEMLRTLSGKSHDIISSFCLLYIDKLGKESVVSDYVLTKVFFRDLSDKEINDYIATGEPMDKAGAYGIQAGAAVFVSKIEGSYTNVVGLPIAQVKEAVLKLCNFS